MLGLTLREEFRGKRLKGTAIELSNDSNTGATQVAAKQFLEITYPTHDLLKGVEAVGPDQGRPVVVIGERGLGKSHLMAVTDRVNGATDDRRNGATCRPLKTGLERGRISGLFGLVGNRCFRGIGGWSGSAVARAVEDDLVGAVA